MMKDRNASSRREIDMAIGVMMAVRHCSERAAFNAIAAAVGETGMSLGSVCRAIIGLASREIRSDECSPVVLGVCPELRTDSDSDVNCR